MIDGQPKSSFIAISSALLVTSLAFVISIIAFLVLYKTDDPFWAELWLFAVLPAALLVSVFLALRDVFRRRSWRESVAVFVLVILSGFLLRSTWSARFIYHQLFTFAPLDLHLPKDGLVFLEKFVVCPEGRPCGGRYSSESRAVTLKKIPEGCCTLSVFSRRVDGSAPDSFRVLLNASEVKLTLKNGTATSPVRLSNQNELKVELVGARDAHLYLVISYDGKNKEKSGP